MRARLKAARALLTSVSGSPIAAILGLRKIQSLNKLPPNSTYNTNLQAPANPLKFTPDPPIQFLNPADKLQKKLESTTEPWKTLRFQLWNANGGWTDKLHTRPKLTQSLAKTQTDIFFVLDTREENSPDIQGMRKVQIPPWLLNAGGICLYYSKSLVGKITVIPDKTNFSIRVLFHRSKLQVTGTYIPPTGSRIWKTARDNRKTTIAQILGEALTTHHAGWRAVVAGDLNSKYNASEKSKCVLHTFLDNMPLQKLPL
ncbi:MAG: endonuclease/exonuclease/phosphatase family protein, partial [Desulfobacteraceae bacterium]|nr:endonuclease/exonuclease/phosphatase family protein [Desulfobacteraceae bacterium]